MFGKLNEPTEPNKMSFIIAFSGKLYYNKL